MDLSETRIPIVENLPIFRTCKTTDFLKYSQSTKLLLPMGPFQGHSQRYQLAKGYCRQIDFPTNRMNENNEICYHLRGTKHNFI
jgi:predicted nucleic acid-binding Zn finger protein